MFILLSLYVLQMQHAVLDFGGAALVPELGADVAAGAAGNVQLVLVAVAALGALPHQLAVVLHDLDLAIIAAHLTVVGLGVQLGIHDVVVDELQHAHDGLSCPAFLCLFGCRCCQR